MAKIAGFASRLLRISFDYWDISFLSISLNFFVIVVLIVVVLVVVILRYPSAAFLFSFGPPYFRNEVLFAGTRSYRADTAIIFFLFLHPRSLLIAGSRI